MAEVGATLKSSHVSRPGIDAAATEKESLVHTALRHRRWESEGKTQRLDQPVESTHGAHWTPSAPTRSFLEPFVRTRTRVQLGKLGIMEHFVLPQLDAALLAFTIPIVVCVGMGVIIIGLVFLVSLWRSFRG